MKKLKITLISILILSTQMMSGQVIDPFLQKLSTYKNAHPDKAKEYKDISGSPYLFDEFIEGLIYFKDTTTVKLPLRYNIFTDDMEYHVNGVNYVVSNPITIDKILLGESVFVYLPFVQNEGYFELFVVGKCTLIQKKLIRYKPAEGPKLIQGVAIPAVFERKRDIFYLVMKDSQFVRIENMKSVIGAFQDQKVKIEEFIKAEKIKRTKKDDLIKIVKYYNSL